MDRQQAAAKLAELRETLASKQPSKDEQRIAELAKMPLLELAQCSKQEAKGLGITVAVLNKLVAEKRRQLAREGKKNEAEAPDADELWRSAGHIINHPQILDLFAAELRREIAGEEANGKLLYLVATSRLFDKTMHAAIKGTSAGGKSEIRKQVLQFFPPESIVALTSMTEKALIYFEGDLAHEIFSMAEAVATEEQSFQDYLLRELISEGRINHVTPQKIGDQIVSVTIQKEGPVAFLVTTTKAKLHPENETRMLSLEIDDTEKQTKNVLRKVAEVRGLNHPCVIDYEPWRNFQRWLESGDRHVVVPYSETLAEMIPPAAVRLRRDFGQVLCAINAHTLLHREQRPRDADGQIVADIENDYEAVRELMNSILSEGAGIAVNPAMVETIEAVEKATAGLPIGEGASAQDIGKILKLDKSAAWRRLVKARGEGLVVNLEVRKGMQGKYRTTQQEVELLSILPSADELREEHENSTRRHTPPESTQPCNRQTEAFTDHEDDGCTDGCNPVASNDDGLHGCKTVARPFATVKSMNTEKKSAPVARLHGNQGGIEEFSFSHSGDSSPADLVTGTVNEEGKSKVVHTDLSDDSDIPACLRRCEQCGQPSNPDKGTVMPRDFGGIRHWLHERCDFEF
jgi:hypothetical protein